MDRSRRSSQLPDGDTIDVDRARKRRRQSSEAPSIRHAIQEVFDAVWNHKERNRNIRKHFEQLPSREENPDFYEHVDNPISLAEIQEKLNGGQYPTIADIKKDLLAMIENATLNYNTKSQIHADALRLRDVVESFITDETGIATPNGRPRRRAAEEAATPSRQATTRGAKNLATLKEIQMTIINEMWNLKDANGQLVSYHYRQLPSKKKYPDYYDTIKNPISLTEIRARIKEGAYKTWTDLELAIKLIRSNAELYNDIQSEIVDDARALERYFHERLHQERLKLNGGDAPLSGIKLKFANPTATVSSTPAQKIKLNVNHFTTTNGHGTRNTRNSTPSISPSNSASPQKHPLSRTSTPTFHPPPQQPHHLSPTLNNNHTSHSALLSRTSSFNSPQPPIPISTQASMSLPPKPSTPLLPSLYLTSPLPNSHFSRTLPADQKRTVNQYMINVPSSCGNSIIITPELSERCKERAYKVSVMVGGGRVVSPMQGGSERARYEVRLPVPGVTGVVEVVAGVRREEDAKGKLGWEEERWRIFFSALQ